MTVLSATVSPAESGMRLDQFLAEKLPELSRSRLKTLIQGGDIQVISGSHRASSMSPKYKVLVGQVYEVRIPAPQSAIPEPENIPLDILFEDDDLLLVNKPAGMAVHPAPGSWTGTLVNALLHHCKGSLSGIGGVERPGIVHRIDKNTTGVLVVAKSEAAHRGLSDLFAAHDIERTYLAITRGAPRPLAGSVDAPIARSLSDRKKMAVVSDSEERGARHAVTHYVARKTFGQISKTEPRAAAALISCQLETGRTHQIRVHMAHIKAPLLGDPVYNRHKGIKAAGTGEGYDAAMQVLRAFDRQALHAASLGFVHPVTGEDVFVETPLPEDMAGVVDALERI